jgi:hypothetical protein
MMMVVVLDTSRFLTPSSMQIYYLCIEQSYGLEERHGGGGGGGVLRHSPARTFFIKE